VLDQRTSVAAGQAQPGPLGANEFTVGEFRLFQHGEHAQRKARVVLEQFNEAGGHINLRYGCVWAGIALAVRH
jgi:hypothetical protein